MGDKVGGGFGGGAHGQGWGRCGGGGLVFGEDFAQVLVGVQVELDGVVFWGGFGF